MSKPTEYRENAALCLEAMRAAIVPEVKESLQSLAQRWNDLADQEERNSGRGADGRTKLLSGTHARHGNDSDRRR
jgi:hypothetical protein